MIGHRRIDAICLGALALAVGIVSGFAATGVNQAAKQLSK